MIHGWAGMRIDGEILTFNPKIWEKWNSYTLRFVYQGATIELHVNNQKARFDLIKGNENIELKIFNTIHVLRKDGIEIQL
jgi:maltose phosphorylase